MGVTAEELGKRLKVIEQTANEIGKDLSNFEVAIHGMVNINDDKQAAYAQAKDYFNHYYGPTYPPESLIKVWLAHGPPKDCARLIQEWIDMGITTPVLRFTAKRPTESGETIYRRSVATLAVEVTACRVDKDDWRCLE